MICTNRPRSTLAISAAGARREGAVLIIVLVCLMVVGMIAGSLVRTAVGERRTVQRQKRELQAMWLAEAGLERGAARLLADPNYTGETWLAPPEELGGSDGGVVEIRVEPAEDQTGPRTIIAQADYPSAAELRARKKLEARVPLTPSGDPP